MDPSPRPRRGASGDGSATSGTRSARGAALTFGAVATGVAAVAVDVLSGEHPSHAVALAVLVMAIVTARRWIAPRFRGLLQLLNVTVMSQPALHLAGKWVGRDATHDRAEASTGFLRSMLPDGLTAGQILLSALIVVAVLTVGRLADLTADAVRRRVGRLLSGPTSIARDRVVLVRADRGRSMLRRGGRLRAVLRGPPPAVLRID